MFYPNLLNLRNVKYQTIDFASFSSGINTDVDESILPIRYGKVSYNYDFADGALKDGIGINPPQMRYSRVNSDYRKLLNLPSSTSVEGAWIFNMVHEDVSVYFPMLVIYCGNGKMYYNYLHGTDGDFIELVGISFTEKPNVIGYNLNGVDTLIMVSNSDGMYTWTLNGGAVKVSNAPKIKSMCLHYERLFATTSDNTRRVWFSDDLNPTNFNISSAEGGFIDIIDDFGRSNKVLSFNDYVYVFRDYNIAQITAFAEQEQFKVNQLYVGNGKIFEDTVAICGNKIMYLASDGLYSFNGGSASKIDLGINKFFEGVDNKYAKAGYSDGYYYLACRINFDEDVVGCESNYYFNNALIKIDVSSGAFTILRGFDVRDICVINDTLGSTVLCIYNNGQKNTLSMIDKTGEVYGVATEKVWQSPSTDLGYPNKDKVINEIYLNNESDCSVVVCADDDTKTFRVKGRKKLNIIRPYMRGKKISIRFVSNVSNVKIENPQIKVGIL